MVKPGPVTASVEKGPQVVPKRSQKGPRRSEAHIRTTATHIAVVLDTKEAPHGVPLPKNISHKEAQEFAKLGLTYEKRADGVLLAVWKGPNTRKKHKFVHNPQAFVNANPPTNVTWRQDGMVEKRVSLEGMKSVWQFNRIGANTYAQQLSSKQVKLADNTVVQSIASKFGGQMHKAFGLPLTAWSRPGGYVSLDVVVRSDDLWLDEGYLYFNRDVAWVPGGDVLYCHGLFLQDTSSDT